jgi:hypothetical protein
MQSKKHTPHKNPEFAHRIQKQIEKWRNGWKDNNNQYDEFTQFVQGNQWLDDEARVFETYKKIPLTFNKLAPMANHLVGEQRQNTPELEVCPENDVPVETVEVREALLKQIAFDSQTDVVYQTAFKCSVIGGFGAYRWTTEYESDYSFEQVIKAEALPIPTRCFWDMTAVSPCKTDGMYSGFTVRISRDKFRDIYGKKIEQDVGDLTLDDDERTVFNDDDAVTMIYYYQREYATETLRRLSNDRDVTVEEFKRLEREIIDGDEMLLDNGIPVTVIDERKVPKYKVMFYLYAGEYELDKSEFPSEQLPIIFLDQNSFFDKEGRQICIPFFKDAKDAQRYINYIGTQSAHLLKISRNDQFMLSKKNVQGNDTAQIWRDPTNIQGGLIYDESPSGIKPEQLRPAELSPALMQQYERAMMDIQSCTGMYNTQMGEQGNEISGTAVKMRNNRGDKNTYIPYANLKRSVVCSGQIINEMIPKVYNNERMVTVKLKDKGATPVKINERMDDYGSQVKNDMTEGRFTIRLLPGPSYEGQKEEALQSMQILLQANPQLFSLIADLYVENLPLSNSNELRNRLRTIVPPEVIQAGKTGEPPPPKPPEPNPEMIKAQAMMRELELKEKKLQQEEQKLLMESEESKMTIQQKWEEIEEKRKENAAQLQAKILEYLAETGRTESDQSIAHANNLVKILTHQPNHFTDKDNNKHGTEKRG